MKKSGLIEGAFIATIAIIFSKIIGALYVIPFYSIIGESGGALYGYAYNIYNIFLIISAAGIPLAISKITSEYNALGKIKEKEYMYNYTKKIIWIFSITSFLICFFGAEALANLILGDLTGGNSIEDVTLVIRSVSIALIIVPILSISRGYLQGHKYIATSSFSQVIEQIVRIAIILIGSYLAIYVFDLPVVIAVAISVFSASIGAIIGYIYLYIKTKKLNIKAKKNQDNIDIEEKKIIKKKLITYAIPFIVVNLSFYIYSSIDMILIIRTLDYLGYAAQDIETISSIFTTWGTKLIAIVTSIGSGLVISLIPSMVAAYTQKNLEEVNKQFGKAMQILLIIILPVSLFLSIYSAEVWSIFYGNSTYGPLIFKYTSLLTFIDCSYLIIGCILQNLNKNKIIYKKICLGLGLNALLDVPLMLIFNELGIYPFYGAILATAIGYTASVSYALIALKKEIKLSYNIKPILKNIIITIIILVPLNIIFSNFIDETKSFVTILPMLGIAGIISAIIYYLINKKILNTIFGKKFINKLMKK